MTESRGLRRPHQRHKPNAATRGPGSAFNVGWGQGLVGLCGAVIDRALIDARKGDIRALVWLSTIQAEPYWHFFGFDQTYGLERCGWRELASQALDNGGLVPMYERLLRQGLDYLSPLPRSVAGP